MDEGGDLLEPGCHAFAGRYRDEVQSQPRESMSPRAAVMLSRRLRGRKGVERGRESMAPYLVRYQWDKSVSITISGVPCFRGPVQNLVRSQPRESMCPRVGVMLSRRLVRANGADRGRESMAPYLGRYQRDRPSSSYTSGVPCFRGPVSIPRPVPTPRKHVSSRGSHAFAAA